MEECDESTEGVRLGAPAAIHRHRRHLWGAFTATEAAAITAFYAFVVEVFIYKICISFVICRAS